MSRRVIRLIVFALVVGVSWLIRNQPNGSSHPPAPVASDSRGATANVGPASETWGRSESLSDHFARHGHDFGARDEDDYAAQAAAFLQRAKTTGLPAKRDSDGSLRVYDPATGTFGAYNANGTTRTFFKPGSPEYFDRQPGERVDLRSGR